MAIDTAAKQMSMLNFGDGTNIYVLPIPDGAYDSADRQHLLDLYSGIAFGGAAPAGRPPVFLRRVSAASGIAIAV